MGLSQYLMRLGYGTRRDTARLLADGRVRRADGTRLQDADDCPRRVPHDDIFVDDAPLDPPPGSVLLVHKPVGMVCSTRDASAQAPLVYALLPDRVLQRTPVLATIGRLDRDTSGLLLLTDDGALNHRLTSPRHHVAKCYRVTVNEPVPDEVLSLFASGTLLLQGETTPCAPAPTERVTPTVLRMTLHEGRYHQVRRMCAAVGLHVTALHREAFGPLTLGELAPGQWRVLTRDERDALTGSRSAP